jgi:transcription initiation factor IIE alpha subunit
MIVPLQCPRCGTPIRYKAPEEPTEENIPKFLCAGCGHVLTETEMQEQAQQYAQKLLKNRQI